jgi:hypothetical protein
LTVNVSPPIDAVPVRAPPEFAATFNVTVPLPVPFSPCATVIQLAFDLVVQVHVEADAVTATATLDAVLATPFDVGAIVIVQGGGGAAA